MRTGFANMIFGVLIAAVGVLVTGLTYSMVSGRGGTYVVAYGAFVVGAWRFLLGLFQVLRAAVAGPGGDRAATFQPPLPSRAEAGPSAPAPHSSNAVQTIGAILIADAVLRLVFFGLLIWRVPSWTIFEHLPVLFFAIVVPAVLIIAGLAVGAALLRNLTAAPMAGTVLCAVGLLFLVYGLVQMASRPTHIVPLLTWTLLAVHIAVYVAGLIVLLRATGRRPLAVTP